MSLGIGFLIYKKKIMLILSSDLIEFFKWDHDTVNMKMFWKL